MCNAYEAYKFYIALKAHFGTKDYDVFTSKGRVIASRSAFEGRRDKKLFERLARQFDKPRDLIQYFVANFAYGNEYSLVDNTVASANYREWQRRKESITRIFSEDCHKTLLTARKNNTPKENVFKFLDSDLPLVLKLLLGSHITIETVVILNAYNDMVSDWDNSLVAESSIMKVNKLKPFVKYDENKIEPVYNKFLSEL